VLYNRSLQIDAAKASQKATSLAHIMHEPSVEVSIKNFSSRQINCAEFL
jgi:hypothetical protein